MATDRQALPLTLLYVEDEQVTRETVSTILGRRFPELTILCAGDGAEGLRLFVEQGADLVITDIKMPAMHGIEMARRILALKPATPVMVTSAHSDVEYLIEAIEIGVSRYVMKPIEKEKLFAAVEATLGALRLEQELRAQQDFIRKLSRAVKQSPSSTVITDPEGIIEYVNPKFTELTGYSSDEALGQHLRAFLPGGEAPWSRLAAGQDWQGEFEALKKGGQPYSAAGSLSPVCDETGEVAHFVAIQEDITERKQAAAEIMSLNEHLTARARELEIANRDLQAFSYTVSHDLRTPLTNINGYCQVILEMYGEGLDEQCQEFIRIIFRESLNMNELIRTLLDFSRVSRKELSRGSVDLSGLALEIVAGLRMRESERAAEVEIAPGLVGQGDRDLMRVVLDNLLGNAWKYSGKKEQARIRFGVSEESGERVYFVRDNGAGFDMEQAHRLFGAFQRLHADSEFTGFGIGLATVQRIIQRHGGRIWAEGVVGEGASFYFTLGS